MAAIGCKDFSYMPSDSSVPEKVLLQRAKEGDAASLSAIVAKYLPLVKKISGRYSGSGLEREDLEQEGVIGVLQAVKYYDSEFQNSFKTFVFICVNSKILSHVTACKKNDFLLLPDCMSSPDGEEADEQQIADGSSADPQTLFIEQEELSTALKRIQPLLSGLEQQVLRCFLFGYTYHETAVSLGVTVKAVDNALQRIRRKMRTVRS